MYVPEKNKGEEEFYIWNSLQFLTADPAKIEKNWSNEVIHKYALT